MMKVYSEKVFCRVKKESEKETATDVTGKTIAQIAGLFEESGHACIKVVGDKVFLIIGRE